MLRRAEPGDVSAIAGLDARCFDQKWGELQWAKEICSRHAHVVVLVVSGHVLGFTCAWEIMGEWELQRIGVAPQARGLGWGERLLAGDIECAAARGCRLYKLEVASRNEVALGLYRAFGLRVVGRRPAYYRSSGDDALLMSLFLVEDGRPSR